MISSYFPAKGFRESHSRDAARRRPGSSHRPNLRPVRPNARLPSPPARQSLSRASQTVLKTRGADDKRTSSLLEDRELWVSESRRILNLDKTGRTTGAQSRLQPELAPFIDEVIII